MFSVRRALISYFIDNRIVKLAALRVIGSNVLLDGGPNEVGYGVSGVVVGESIPPPFLLVGHDDEYPWHGSTKGP